jgi:20S proteasome alpha/beta subunit
LAGIDHLGVQLVQVDPSGTTFKGAAFAIGQASDDALETIVKGYRPNLSVEEALALATQAVEGVNGGKSVIEHGVVTTTSQKFEHQDLANAVA